MKILVVGEGHSPIHEVAVVDAFKKMKQKVKAFYWHSYFHSYNPIKKIIKKIENKFLFGPSVNKVNKNLLKKVFRFKPDLIFIYRGTHILPETIIKIKNSLKFCKIYGYNNDNPYSKQHPFYLWRHFFKCVQIYDLIFAYRNKNLQQFKKCGAKKVDLLRSWFIPEKNFPIALSQKDKDKYECDVVFAGHFENDGRIEYLEEIVKAGYDLKIFGPPKDWNNIILKSPILKNLYPIHQVWNHEYSKAISGAKIALCFFSKLNKDTYTRRCFEIPAIGTMLLSEYSKDMTLLFKREKEADFFTTKKSMIKKINFYINKNKVRKKIALNGYRRVVRDGHDIHSRMSKVLKNFRSCNGK